MLLGPDCDDFDGCGDTRKLFFHTNFVNFELISSCFVLD